MKRILLLCFLVDGLKAAEGSIILQPQDFVKLAGRIVYHQEPGQPSVVKPYEERVHKYLSRGEVDNMKISTRSQDALQFRANTTLVETKFQR